MNVKKTQTDHFYAAAGEVPAHLEDMPSLRHPRSRHIGSIEVCARAYLNLSQRARGGTHSSAPQPPWLAQTVRRRVAKDRNRGAQAKKKQGRVPRGW
eukprot:contig_2387_g451